MLGPHCSAAVVGGWRAWCGGGERTRRLAWCGGERRQGESLSTHTAARPGIRRAGGRAHPVAAHVAEHLEAAVRVVRAVVPAGLDHLIYPQFEVIRAIMLDDSPYVLHEQSTHRLDEAHHPQPDPRQCRDLEVNRRLIIPNKRQGKRRDMWHQPARRERKRVCGSGG